MHSSCLRILNDLIFSDMAIHFKRGCFSPETRSGPDASIKGKKRVWTMSGESVARPKADRFGKRFLLCVWWCTHGMIHFKLLKNDQTVTAEIYCRQMTRVAEKIRRLAVGMSYRDRPVLLLNNAKPHTASQMKSTLVALGFDVLPHPAYSPDISPSDCYLFRSMKHSLREQCFNNRYHIEKWLSDFFESKSQSFYEKGIFSLEDRWKQVFRSGAKYVDQ